MTNEHAQIKRMTLMSMLTAIGVVFRVIRVLIPNVQPVTDMIMIVTLIMGIGFGISLAMMIMIVSNLVLGFGIWTIPQILTYAVCVLTVAGLAKALPIRKHLLLQVILAGFLGFEYGFFISIGVSIYGGLAAFVVYWLNGLLFDGYHALGNVAFYFILYKPLAKMLRTYFNLA